MYKRILLASDGARESLVALREGALIARVLGATAYLLIVDADSPGVQMASGVHPVTKDNAPLRELLALGLTRLERLGVEAKGDVRAGDPATIIAEVAKTFRADLIVVGHRRRTLLERWWSGESGAYLVDRVPCSVLVARDLISDAEFEAHLAAEAKAD
jgi:nucleotide-binding universal stress UspA family protein